MDEDTKIKDKFEDLQRFRPLLEEMLKWAKVGEKNAAAHEKLQKMYEIVIGQTPCSKLGHLIRIEEAILKWAQKKKESIKEPRLQNFKKRVGAEESLNDTKSNKTAKSVESSEPIEVIALDSSDDEDIQIVSYTLPEPKNKIDESKAAIKNAIPEIEDGEIDDAESIISIVDGSGIQLEDVESEKEENNFPKEKENFPKEKEHFSKEVEGSSKHGIKNLSKEAEHFYEEDEFSSLDSLASYHDKPALKTYGCQKISKTDNNYHEDLRSFLNARRMTKKQSKDEPNISNIHDRKEKVKKREDVRVVISNIPLREKTKNVKEDNYSSKTSSAEKDTEKPGSSISREKIVRVIEIVTEEPKKELPKNIMETIEQKTTKHVQKDPEENKVSKTENKKRHCEKHEKSPKNNEIIPIDAKSSKSDTSSVANSTNNQETEKSAEDKFLDILHQIDLTPDSENELEKDQDLDIFDEAIYSSIRRNSDSGPCERTSDVNRAENSDRTNIPDKNEVSSSTLVKQINNEKGKTTTENQFDLTIEQANSKISPSSSDSIVHCLYDSDTEDFIKKLTSAIDSNSEPKSVEETSIETNQPTTKDSNASKETAMVEKDPKSPIKNSIQTVEETIKQNDSNATSKILIEYTPSYEESSNSSSTNSKQGRFKPITLETLNDILVKIKETLKKSQSKLDSSILESEIEQESARGNISEPKLMDESIQKELQLTIELAASLKTSIEAEAVSPQSEKPLFERRPQKKGTTDRVIETVRKPINHLEFTENRGSSSEDGTSAASREDNNTAVDFQDTSSVPENQSTNSRIQIDEWANKDLSELQEIRMQLEKELGVNLETMFQADQDEESSDNDTLALNVVEELEEAMKDDFLEELPEPEIPTVTSYEPSYEPPMNFFAQSNFPMSHNLPQYLGLPPEIKPNDPRLKNRLTLLYAKTTDSMQLKTIPFFKKKPSLPTADEILGSQAEKVQEEIRSACMQEIGQSDYQITPNLNTQKNQPSTSSTRPQARTYGEYKRLKQAALEAEAARKRAAIEAANRALEMELELQTETETETERERERQTTLDTEKKRLRSNEFEHSQDYETDGEIIFAKRKKRAYVLSSSSESESQAKKSSTKQRLRKKRIRAKSPQLSLENEIEQNFSIDSDTVGSTTNSANFPLGEEHEDTLSSNILKSNELETLLSNHNLPIDTNNKEQLKELACTVMKSLLKENKFQEFKKLLDTNLESNEKNPKKSVSPTAGVRSKGEISNRELAALNKDLHDMFIKDDVLMIGKRKSSVRSLKRIEQHYKQTKSSVSGNAEENFEQEFTLQKNLKEQIYINITKNSPVIKLTRLTEEEIMRYTQLGQSGNLLETTEDDEDLLKPMKVLPFAQGVARARRQSQSSRPKKETKNTNPKWHYKDPHYSKCCIVCNKKFSNLVEHYVIHHPNNEIYIARLPQDDIHYLEKNPGKAKTTGEQNKKGQLIYSNKCFFCEHDIVGRFDQLSHHYASHTGEFPYECSACNFMSIFKSVATRHSKTQCKKDAKVLTYYAYDEKATKINLYICSKCNYMQLHKANVVLHLRKEHSCKLVCESDVRELLLLEYVEQNFEIVNEPVSTVPKADDVEIVFEIQTGSKIDLPIIKKDYDTDSDSIISDISIDMKPDSFELDLIPNQLTTKNTSIVPDLSKFDAKGEQIVTVVHLPASVNNDIENKGGEKSNFEKLLEELNLTTSPSDQHNEPLVVAKPKGKIVTEPTLEEPIQVKLEPEKEDVAESKENDNKTDKIQDNHTNVEKSMSPTISNSIIKSSPKEIVKTEQETNPLSEDISIEEGQDGFITVIEIVNDDDDVQTDLSLKEPHPEPKIEDEFAPLRIENFGYQEVRKDEFLFHCLVDKCNMKVTVSFEVLKDHASTDHDIKWSGKCNICKNEAISTGSLPIDEELNHMLAVHIKELPESQKVDENHAQSLLKPWISEIKSRKHKILCEAMLSEKAISRLYKCMGDDCSFTAETKLQMSKHLADHELRVRQSPNPERSWLECSYCEFVATKTLYILEHIDLVHSKSIYQCSRCFYRSCTTVNLKIHHDKYHRINPDKNKIIKCSGNKKRLKTEVERITKLAAQNIEALSCSVCGARYIRRDIMIRHLQEAHKEIGIPKGFPMGLFSCIFCKFETDGLEEIRFHMANQHPEELLYIGVRGIGEKNTKKDIATIAHIGVEEKDDDDSQSQALEPEVEVSKLTAWDLNKKYETFKKNLMNVRDLEKLCNPSITIDSDDDSCGNEDAEVNDESTMELYKKLIEMLKYFIKSEPELNPCCICMVKINLEDQWCNHFKTAHGEVNSNTFHVCPQCPTLCTFLNYPSHYINTHNKTPKNYFCYFCGKNFNTVPAAKLHLMSHSVYEQAKLIRVKMKQDLNTVNNNKNDIDYQIILPRKYNKKISDIIKHMMGVLEKRKIAEGKIVKVPVDLENFTIELNENNRGMNYPAYISAGVRYVCSYCKVLLTDERAFEQHFKQCHSAFKVFKCPHCDTTLFNVSNFDRIRDHIRIHAGIFFMCCFCKMYTSNRIYLIEHLKRYKRDSVPIIVYARTSITEKHHFEVIHFKPLSKASGTKIKCLFCTTFVGSPKDLGDHMQNIHGFTRQYQCDYCAFRGDEEIVDMHVKNTHVNNVTGNTNCDFRTKTIFQKNLYTHKYVKRKSDDIACLPESSTSIEKKNKSEDSIIELDCEYKTEKLQSIEAPIKICDITDLPVQEFFINVPSAQSSSTENNIKEITVEVPSLQKLTKTDSAKEITVIEAPVKETPVEDSPSKKLSTTTFSRSLKCEFCPLKCISTEDLLKHLNLRHGVTLLETSETVNQSVAATNVTSTITTPTSTITTLNAESTSPTKETSKVADVTSLEPPRKKIRLVPLEKLLDPKIKGTQIENRVQQVAPIQIVQNPRDQNVIQQPFQINITQSSPLQAAETFVCKFMCIHCSTKFDSQEKLTAHWQNSCPVKWTIFICYNCNSQFSNFKLLITHWNQNCLTNSVNRSYRYRISGDLNNQLPDRVTNSFLEVMSKLPIPKSNCYQCPECSQAYFDHTIGMNHIKTKMHQPYYSTHIQEVILYGCNDCKVFFVNEQDAIKHISKHTFQFGCLFCFSAYKTQDELYAHYVQVHSSIERRHKCIAITEPNMKIYREMLVAFPYGLILTKWNLRDTIWGNMENFTRLIKEVDEENR